MKKIRTGDEVIVIAGKNKGQRGKVVKVVTSAGKLVVANVNIAKKHVKPNPQTGEEGGIINVEMPIDASNVAIYNPGSNKADRVGFKFEKGKKLRVYKSTGELVK